MEVKRYNKATAKSEATGTLRAYAAVSLMAQAVEDYRKEQARGQTQAGLNWLDQLRVRAATHGR